MLWPVIMAGGASSRLWPLSRRTIPKWTLKINGKSLIQMAWERALSVADKARVMVVVGEDQEYEARGALQEIDPKNILVEPMGADTAACIALAAGAISVLDSDATMLILPGDHLISPLDVFVNRVLRAANVAEKAGAAVTLGIKPRNPATCYGYIHKGKAEDVLDKQFYSEEGAFPVSSFHEKPTVDAATEYINSGEYYWNAGIFIWTIPWIMREMEWQLPEHAQLIKTAQNSNAWADRKALRESYLKLKKISIDHGILEHARSSIAVIEAGFEWDDIGSWSALMQHMEEDSNQNRIEGNVLAIDSWACLALAPTGKQIVLIGLEDIAVVDTADALLVCRLDNDQYVKKAVEELRRRGKVSLL